MAETEEDIKIKRVVPFLVSRMKFSSHDLKYEQRITVQLGTRQQELRCDIVGYSSNKPLLAIEVKGQKQPLLKKDLLQVISYASNHDPPIPFAMITNGSIVEVVETFSRKTLGPCTKESLTRFVESQEGVYNLIHLLGATGQDRVLSTQYRLIAQKQFGRAARHFQRNFLTIVDLAMKKGVIKLDSPPFLATATCVAFPDRFGAYRGAEMVQPPLRGKYPIMFGISKVTRLDEQESSRGNYIIEARNLIELPQLPKKCGYVHGWDYEYMVPNRVESYPSRAFHGAYFWIRPWGLRGVSCRLWVWDPEEVKYSIAMWWNLNRDKPATEGFRLIRKISGEEIPAEEREIEINRSRLEGLLSDYRRMKEMLDGAP